MLSSSLAQRILQRFPKNLAYCFAYGSGVKKQAGYDDRAQKNAMVDLIVCVDDELQFHGENLKLNPGDYSFMRYFGRSFIANYQDYAAGVYCNTLIPIDDTCTIKYGVIRTSNLCDDLCHWTHLYVAGRLQKPIETLIAPTNPKILTGLEENLDMALRLALLLLPEKFSYFDLFHEIANISYYGDFRMVFGEQPDKVRNIVEPQLGAFLQLYAPHMQRLKHCLTVPDYQNVVDQELEQSKEAAAYAEHLAAMPSNYRDVMGEEGEGLIFDTLRVTDDNDFILRGVIRKINFGNSIRQSAKNILTAGFVKSVRYSARKAMKTFS